MSDLSVVLSGYSFLECPRWHDDRIWVSDFHTHQVVSAREDGGDVRVEAEVPAVPGGLGWLPDGRLLIASTRDHKLLRREFDGSLTVHADLAPYATGPLNDMIVDEVGRAYVGDSGFNSLNGEPTKAAPLIVVEPDGSASLTSEALHFANGPVLRDNELIIGETLGNRLSVFARAADGTLGERRDWATFGEVPTSNVLGEALGQTSIRPDGISIDSQGYIWVADILANRVIRVARGGEIVDEISTGDAGCWACMLGGSDGHTLFLCTSPIFEEAETRAKLLSKLLAIRVDVPA